MTPLDYVKKFKVWIIIGVIALIAIIVPFKINGTRNSLVSQGTTLSAQFQDNQANLSKCLLTIHETFQIANTKAGKIDKVLEDAVKGRYEGETSAAPAGGSLISALREAYPDLSGLDSYDRVSDTLVGCRSDYASLQSKMLDMLRSYEAYRNKGIVHSQIVSSLGYPNLVARIGKIAYKNERALDQMHLIVTTTESNKASETGTQDTIDFGK